MFKFDNPLLRDGFSQTPNAIMRCKVLSIQEKAVYSLLLSYAWNNQSCFPTQATLAEDLNVSDRYVRELLKSLETKLFLKIEQQGLTRPNVYHFLDFYKTRPDLFVANNPDRNQGSAQGRKRGSTPKTGTRVPTKNTQILKERIEAYKFNLGVDTVPEIVVQKWREKIARGEPIF